MEQPRRSARAEFWQQILDEHSKSDLSVNAFCSQKSLSVQSFYQWKRRLRLRVADAPSPTLVPVRIVPAESHTLPQSIQLMTPSGFTLRFDASISTQQLAQVLEAIESTKRGEQC